MIGILEDEVNSILMLVLLIKIAFLKFVNFNKLIILGYRRGIRLIRRSA